MKGKAAPLVHLVQILRGSQGAEPPHPRRSAGDDETKGVGAAVLFLQVAGRVMAARAPDRPLKATAAIRTAPPMKVFHGPT